MDHYSLLRRRLCLCVSAYLCMCVCWEGRCLSAKQFISSLPCYIAVITRGGCQRKGHNCGGCLSSSLQQLVSASAGNYFCTVAAFYSYWWVCLCILMVALSPLSLLAKNWLCPVGYYTISDAQHHTFTSYFYGYISLSGPLIHFSSCLFFSLFLLILFKWESNDMVFSMSCYKFDLWLQVGLFKETLFRLRLIMVH